jgi:hypothetical protein
MKTRRVRVKLTGRITAFDDEPLVPLGMPQLIVDREHEHQWRDLVGAFLDGAKAAAAMGQEPERLAVEVEPGVTMADELYSVAVHNAYHLSKIVALRQRIGAWPPMPATDES